MKHERKGISISGLVTAVFARRFVVEDNDGKHLAYLGSEASVVDLHEGDKVTFNGRCKHSEIKVSAIAKEGGEMIFIDHKGGHGHDKNLVRHDPRLALAAVKLEGYTVLGAPLGKPKHFEILGRSAKRQDRGISCRTGRSHRQEKTRGHESAEVGVGDWRPLAASRSGARSP